MTGYVICTERRSGSNYLGRLLSSTRLLGRAWEFFDKMAVVQSGIADWPNEPEAQLARIPKASSFDNGVYGLKVFSDHFDATKSTNWTTKLPNLKFVYLEREDILGQAISLVRAEQTQEWTTGMLKMGDPIYSRQKIDWVLSDLTKRNARWRLYFARNQIPFLHLVYEEIMLAPQESVQAVADLVGLTQAPVINSAMIDVAIQRDEINDTWRDQYVTETKNMSAF
jgi:trehalose 2-sulfotransferase